MKNVKYISLQMFGDNLFGFVSDSIEPTRDNSILDTDSITEGEREIDRRYYEHKEAMEKWEKTLKKFKVHSSCKEELLDEARIVWTNGKYHNYFDNSIGSGIEIDSKLVEVRTDIKHCKGSNHAGEPCFFGKKGNTCNEDCDVKQFIYKKMDALDEIKSELYVGSEPEDDSIDWVIKHLNEKGYEIVKKKN
jgi:hypothetical protein